MPTFDTPEPISVSMEIPSGGMQIRGEERPTTVVDVQPSDPASEADRRAAQDTRVEFDGRRLVVKGPRGASWLLRSRAGSVAVTVELPAGSHVDATGGMADIDCEGRIGDCRLRTGLGRIHVAHAGSVQAKTATGDIDVDLATGHVEVHSASGDVRVRELDHTGVVKNGNGDIWVGAVAGDLRVGSANGSIAVDRAGTSLEAKTANGDVRVGEIARGSIVLQTRSGDLDIGIREGTAAWLDVRSLTGRVQNSLDAAAAPEPSAPTVEVRARTTAGDIAIRRA
jgi:hypothetical protein